MQEGVGDRITEVETTPACQDAIEKKKIPKPGTDDKQR
jgi:hypothetical protein